MSSEIRVNKINNRAGLGTVTYTDTGIIVSGIVTAYEFDGNFDTTPGIVVTGIATAQSLDVDDFVDVGSNIKLGNAGVVTATTFSGSGASLTSIANANISNSAAIAGSKISPNFGTQTLTAGLGYFTNNLNTTSNFSMTGGSTQINFNRASHSPNYRISLTGASNPTMNFRIKDTTNNLDRFIIRHGGNIEIPGDVGIGHPIDFNTTNVVKFGSYSTLHIKGPSNNGAAIRLQDNGDTADSDDFVIYKNHVGGYLRVNGTDPLIAYMNGAEKVRITSAGRLQINTNGDLYIVGSSYNSTLNGNILSFDRAGYSYIQNSHDSGSLNFRVTSSNTIALRLDNAAQALFPQGVILLGTQNTSSGHINAYENMSFNIDSDNDDTNRYFSFHANGMNASGSELVRITEGGLVAMGGNANLLDSALSITNSVGDCIRLRSNTTNNTFKYGVIKVDSYGNSSNGVQIIGGKSDSSYSEVSIGGGVDTGYAATQIHFVTAANTTTQPGTVRVKIDSSGRLLVGHTVTDDRDGYNSSLQVSGTTGDGSSMTIGRWSDNNSSPGLVFSKSRNGAIGSHTVLQGGDYLGSIQFQGDDGSNYHVGASIQARVEAEGAGSDDMPTRLFFNTNRDEANVANRMIIHGRGNDYGVKYGGRVDILGYEGQNITGGSKTNVLNEQFLVCPSAADGYADSHTITFGQTKGNWESGTSSAYDTSYGLMWFYGGQYNSTRQLRSGIHYDHKGQERFKFWSSYGDIIFKTRSTSQGDYTSEECDQEPLRITDTNRIGINRGGTASVDETLDVDGGARFRSYVYIGDGFYFKSQAYGGNINLDLGISINQGGRGGCGLLLASRNYNNGTGTSAGIYRIKWYYDGNNAPVTHHMSGDDFISFGVSGSNTLTINGGGGNQLYGIINVTA